MTTPNIYEPREDSYLLQSCVRRLAKGSVLDMGTGSGIQAVTALSSSKVKKVVGVDIQPQVIAHCKQHIKKKRITFLQSDLFSYWSKKKQTPQFDTIIFNPPYLPRAHPPDITLDGGKHGYEIIQRFLQQVSSYVSGEGIVLLLFSSLSKPSTIHECLNTQLLDYTCIASEKHSFEELFVYKIIKNQFHRTLLKRGVTNISFFAKGKRGFIYTGHVQRKKVAIKSNNPQTHSLNPARREARWLGQLNKKNIGPRMLWHGENYFVYEFVEGTFFEHYLLSHQPSECRNVIKKICDQLRVLDELQVQKEEMHRPYKHILINKKGSVTLLDFERAHYVERPHNLSQFIQCLTGNRLKKVFEQKKMHVPRAKLRQWVKKYRMSFSNDSYRDVLAIVEEFSTH